VFLPPSTTFRKTTTIITTISILLCLWWTAFAFAFIKKKKLYNIYFVSVMFTNFTFFTFPIVLIVCCVLCTHTTIINDVSKQNMGRYFSHFDYCTLNRILFFYLWFLTCSTYNLSLNFVILRFIFIVAPTDRFNYLVLLLFYRRILNYVYYRRLQPVVYINEIWL